MNAQITQNNNAFVKWLIAQDRHIAIAHFIECLKHGEQNNQAWTILENVHGDWSCKPEELPSFINNTLDKLKEKT